MHCGLAATRCIWNYVSVLSFGIWPLWFTIFPQLVGFNIALYFNHVTKQHPSFRLQKLRKADGYTLVLQLWVILPQSHRKKKGACWNTPDFTRGISEGEKKKTLFKLCFRCWSLPHAFSSNTTRVFPRMIAPFKFLVKVCSQCTNVVFRCTSVRGTLTSMRLAVPKLP